MPTETAATTGPTANNKSSLKPRTGATSKALSPATMAARRQASARYREKNLEEEQEKARARMARLREKVMQEDDLAEDFRARAREATNLTYGMNASALAHRQRIIRMEAFGKKHGHHAWLERHNLREERRAEAREHEELAALRRLYGEDARA
ncbi:hypothetical protein B0H14DRAFT_3452100 [Mycena olivaceomarginata]|nr:hypothetical protein B0H14DRAFT_3452100 [Mycena olivaceomarginata]